MANLQAIFIPDEGVASPYPSTITVSNSPGVLTRVSVTLSNISHTYPGDIDVLLVGPGGEGVILMASAGGGADLVNNTITFDDWHPPFSRKVARSPMGFTNPAVTIPAAFPHRLPKVPIPIDWLP